MHFYPLLPTVFKASFLFNAFQENYHKMYEHTRFYELYATNICIINVILF